MVTKEQLEKGIEWISGKTKITVEYDGSHVDIALYPDYPNEQSHISLFLDIQWNNRVRVTDLVGNGYYSDYQGGGYGTLIFNIGIQALYAFYGITPSDPLAHEIVVFGKVSSSGDPDEDPARSECRDRRNGFWAGHGFKLKEPEEFDTTMKARLVDLHLRVGGMTANGTPRTVELEEFWLKGEAPTLFKSDLQALMSANLEQFNLEACPTKADIEKAWTKAVRASKAVRLALWTLLSGASIYLSFLLLDPLEALSFSLAGVFGSHLLTLLLDSRIWQYFPSYRQYRKMQDKRGEVIAGVRGYIEALEESHNGLMWRLHQGLKGLDATLADEVFADMAEASRKQYAFRLSDRYEDYKRFVESAKGVIIGRGLLCV